MNRKLIYNKINAIIEDLEDIKSLLTGNKKLLKTDSEFEELKKMLLDPKWPKAVNPNLICDLTSETDKKERGIGILQLLIEESMNQDSKFLDFGCGEGYCAISAPEVLNCGFSLGYDSKNFNWIQKEKVNFTSSFDKVVSHAPYDVILMFDVLDHLDNDSLIEVFKKVRSVISPKGKIYIRVHPWISRHGSHLYLEEKFNKAFIHLVFTEKEIKEIATTINIPNIKVFHPYNFYKKSFSKAGFKILNEHVITEFVEPFFKNSLISKRIIKNTNFKYFPENQMKVHFIDYIITLS